MASRFLALPLGTGEAFLLETQQGGKDWAILVDSGNLDGGTPHPLVDALNKTAPKLRHIDIAICTHRDTDHARGFEHLADEWCGVGRTIGEFWLPGRWAAAMPKLLLDPAGLADSLWQGAVEASSRLVGPGGERTTHATEESRIRDLARELEIDSQFTDLEVADAAETSDSKYVDATDEDRDLRLSRTLGLTNEELVALDISMEESDRPPSVVLDEIASLVSRWVDPFWIEPPFVKESISISSIVLDAITTAKTIAIIAESTVRWRIPIRWFDFGQFEQTGRAKGAIKLMHPLILIPRSLLEKVSSWTRPRRISPAVA
jgi:hypothetical protein